MFSKILILAFVSIFFTQVLAEDCEECNMLNCPDTTICPVGWAQDPCGCCEICAQGLNQKCDYIPEGTVAARTVNGTCGDYLFCSEQRVCQCEEEGSVCGSDDVTYKSLCVLMEATAYNNDLTLTDREPCRKGPIIKSPPKDATMPRGSILVLACEAAGFPVPAITWELYRPDGSTIPLPNDNSLVAVQVRGGPEKNMATGWVQIMKILPENVGIYACIATNFKGEAKATATVTFKEGRVTKRH